MDRAELIELVKSHEDLAKASGFVSHKRIAGNPPGWLPKRHEETWARVMNKHKPTSYGAAVTIFKRHLEKKRGKFETVKHKRPDEGIKFTSKYKKMLERMARPEPKDSGAIPFGQWGKAKKKKKSGRVKQHYRRTKTGKAVVVKEHGRVLGRTSSGKKIFDTHNHPKHAKFTSRDHRDAEKHHLKLANTYVQLSLDDPTKAHDWQAELHARKAAYHRIESMRKKNLRKSLVIALDNDDEMDLQASSPMVLNGNPQTVLSARGTGYMAQNRVTEEHIIRPNLDQLMMIAHPREIFDYYRVTYDKKGNLITSEFDPNLSQASSDRDAYVVLQEFSGEQGGSSNPEYYRDPTGSGQVSDSDKEYGVDIDHVIPF